MSLVKDNFDMDALKRHIDVAEDAEMLNQEGAKSKAPG